MGARHLPPERAWNTWDAKYPGCYLHLPSGLAIRLSAYSTAARRSTVFPFDADSVRLGAHEPDGSYAEVELGHAGSRLRVRFAHAEAGSLVGDVEILETAEWGLRFWYAIEVGADRGPGATVHLLWPMGQARYVETPIAVGVFDERSVAVAPSIRPFGAHLHDDRDAAARDLERWGYYHRPREEPAAARWALFRFNAVIPRVAFAACFGGDEGEALNHLRRTLPDADRILAERAGRAQRPWREAAVRDIVAWNTVWDSANERAYTTATRGWVSEKFGGWIVWQMDAFFNALLAAHAGDAETALANLDAALDCRTSAGNLAALRSGVTEWVDRSHPPIGAHVAWALFLRLGDRSILERSYPVLGRAFEWWFEARDGNGNGVLEYGSSPVGDGHFVHTKLAAMDESAMDNSPVHDEATFDERTHTLDVEDVGLNSLLVHEAELLARMAEELGRPEDASGFRRRGADLAERIRAELWDADRGIYANRLWDGRFVRSLAPTSFYPLLAGLATPEQAGTMVREHLMNEDRFGGDYPVAGTPHDDPASRDNIYWRGRVWPCLNYLVYRGLRRYRLDGAAAELAAKSVAMFQRGWAERRSYENFNQRTGEGGDSVDSEPFYSWGALLPLLEDMELIDLDPLNGLVFGAEGTEPGTARLATPEGTYRVEVDDRTTRLLLDEDTVLEANRRGRFRDLRVSRSEVSVELPALPEGAGVRVRAGAEIERVRLGDQPLEFPGAGDSEGSPPLLSVVVPPTATPRRLLVELRVDAP